MNAKKAVFMSIGIQHGLNAKSHHKRYLFQEVGSTLPL